MGDAVHVSADPPPMPWLEYDPLGSPVDPALGGPLVLGTVAPASAGGLVRVVTDALQAHSERLGRLSEQLCTDATALGRIPLLAADALESAPAAAHQSVGELLAAHTMTRAAADDAVGADLALRRAIDEYSVADADERRRSILLGEQLARMLGPVIRDALVLGLPAILIASAAGIPDAAQIRAIRQWMLDHPEVITSPGFVEAVRAGVMGLDDGVGSALGLPPGVAAALAGAAGFTGVQAGGAYLLGAAQPFGLFRDGPVTVDRVSTTSLTAGPRGAVERLARVPEGNQLRIERYDAPGERPRFIVYVGPTETFSPVATDEPWDLTSNVTGVEGLSSGSIRATEAAMIDAGITSSDEVQFVGFSQGGLVATRLAASADWRATGLETYGAPAGNIELPANLAGMAVRNTDDFVPALAGPQLDHHLLQVERRAFSPGSPIPTELPAPAHQRSAYVAAATEIDLAESSAVRQQLAALDAFTHDYTSREGSRVTVMMYHAERGAWRGFGGSRAVSGASPL